MRREPPWPPPNTVVHVVGRVTDEVFSFLGPATNALASSGFEQYVVMIDDPRYRRHVAGLHESAELVLMPSLRNPIQQWRAVLHACRAALTGRAPHAVHLHGIMPYVVGALALRVSAGRPAVFYSPHGSRSIGALRAIGSMVMWFVWPIVRASRSTTIVNVPNEARAFENWGASEVVESPVGDAFFKVQRREARHPLIVTGGRHRGARNAELFAQLAVLLSGEDLHASFNWIGTVDEVSYASLNAAGIGIFDAVSDADCASKLAAGWIYVAPGSTRGFPLFLVQAMAVGLPCVALDCEQHREVIAHGETGYLCRSERDMIERVAALIDDPVKRRKTGDAAMVYAKARFGEARFAAKLLAAYVPEALSIPSARSGAA